MLRYLHLASPQKVIKEEERRYIHIFFLVRENNDEDFSELNLIEKKEKFKEERINYFLSEICFMREFDKINFSRDGNEISQEKLFFLIPIPKKVFFD